MNSKQPENKYANFSDDELYILSRMAIESSWDIAGIDSTYSEEEKRLYAAMLNQILDEYRRRQI